MATDFDPQELRDLMAAMRANTGALGDLTDSIAKHQKVKIKGDTEEEKKRESVYKKWKKSVDESTDHLGESFHSLGGGASAAADHMRRFAREWIPAAGVLVGLAGWGKHTLDTWREVNEVGQNFGGSMFGLAQAAEAAGLPMTEFAKVIRNNSKVVATFGARDVTNLMKSVRAASQSQGMYGYTIDGLNDITGKYLETQRLYGNKTAAVSKQSVAAIGEFAKEVTAVAGATGVAREQIIETTMKAMQDIALTSRMAMGVGENMEAFSKRAMQATAILAGLPGEAGQTFTTFLTQTLGWGTSLFTDAAHDFVESGMGSMLSSVQNLADAVNAGSGNVEGATWSFVEDFKKQAEANMAGLRIQAMSGNASAKKILEMYAQVKNLTQAEYERMKKQQQQIGGFTAFIASLSNIFQGLLGKLVQGIFGKLSDIDKQMGDMTETPGFKALEGTFLKWGESIGAFLKTITPEEVNAWATAVSGFIQGMFGIVAGIAKVGEWATDFATAVKKFVVAIEWPIVKISSLFGKNAEKNVRGFLSGLGTVGAILATFLAYKGIKSVLGNFFGQRFRAKNVRVLGETVMVNGAGGGGWGGGGDLFEGGGGGFWKGKGKGSRIGRMARRARAAELRAMRAARAGQEVEEVGHLARLGRWGGRLGMLGMGVMGLGGGALGMMGPVGKFLGRGVASAGEKVGGKIGLRLGGKVLGRLGGAFIPGVGAAIDGLSAANAFKNGHHLAGGLYGIAAALNGAGAFADGTILGAPIGLLLDGLGGLATAGAMASESTGFGDHLFGGGKSKLGAKRRGGFFNGFGKFLGSPLGMVSAAAAGPLGLAGAATLGAWNWFNDPSKDAAKNATAAQAALGQPQAGPEGDAAQARFDDYMRTMKDQNDQLIALNRSMLDAMNRQLSVSKSLLSTHQ